MMPGFPRARDPATRARLSNRAQDWGQPQAYHCVGCLNESGKESSCQFEKPENYPWASWYRTASNSFSLLERIFISQTRQLSKSNPVSQVKSGTSNAENAKPAFFFFFFFAWLFWNTLLIVSLWYLPLNPAKPFLGFGCHWDLRYTPEFLEDS